MSEVVEHDFTAFVLARHQRWIRSAVLMGYGVEDVEDAVQHAQTEVWRRWRKVSCLEFPDAYVVRVILNRLAAEEKKKRKRAISTRGASLAAEGHHPQEAIATRAVLAQALAALPDSLRVTLVLRYYMDLSEHATAAALDVPVGTVKSRAHRALIRLSQDPCLKQERNKNIYE